MAENKTTTQVGDAADHVAREGTRTRPANNATYLAVANVGSKVFSLAFVAYAARALGAGLYGNYGAANAFVGLFSFFTDLGLSTLAVRDVTQDRSQAARYISNVLLLRLLFAVADVALIAAAAQVLVNGSLRTAVYAAALALVPLAVSGTLQLVFQFSERLAYSAVFGVVTAALSAGLRMLVLYLGHHVLGLMIATTAVTALSSLAMAWLVYTRFLPRRLEFDPRWWPVLLRRAIPFMTIILLNILYANADRLILYVQSGCRQSTTCVPTGRYTAAYQVLEVLTMIFVGSASTATFPAFSRVAGESREALVRVVRSAVTLMLAFGAPVALFGSFFAADALHVVAGRQYMVAAPALAILVWAFPCFLILSMLYNALWAMHRQAIVNAAFGTTLVFNVMFNILLIPRYSYLASSALTVASELLNGVIVGAALWRYLGPLRLAPAVLKVAAIVATTGAILWLLHPYGIFVGLPAGVVVALAGVRLTRVLGPIEHEILERLPLVGRFAGLL